MKKGHEKPFVEIFADGACSGNPGAGGYGIILRSGDREKELSGCEPMTTNNRMELTAVIKALEALKKTVQCQGGDGFELRCSGHDIVDNAMAQKQLEEQPEAAGNEQGPLAEALRPLRAPYNRVEMGAGA